MRNKFLGSKIIIALITASGCATKYPKAVGNAIFLCQFRANL